MKKNSKADVLALAWTLGVCILVLGAFSLANAQSATTITTEMDPGDSGAQVSALQTFLASDSSVYPQGLVTGYYGSLTEAAVQAYQCKYGIVCSGDPTSTGYGRVGPSTLAQIQMQEGGGSSTSLPPTGYPLSAGSSGAAPIIGAPSIATTSNSASISWSTNEPATSLVMYGTSWPFVFVSAPDAQSTNGLSENASVNITGLSPNTTYYYVLQSTDASGDLQWSFNHSFTTGS